jgi:predicted ATPase with chaperone activity
VPAATTFTAAFIGAEAHIVTIDAVSTDGSPGLHLDGLLDQPARDRVQAGILNSGLPWPSA